MPRLITKSKPGAFLLCVKVAGASFALETGALKQRSFEHRAKPKPMQEPTARTAMRAAQKPLCGCLRSAKGFETHKARSK